MEYLSEENQEEIKKLLIGNSIKKIGEDELLLSNGTILKIIPNFGCGGCSAGKYSITELNESDNVITDVEFNYKQIEVEDWDFPYSYKIFVVSGNRNLLLQVDGDDGNGYYGTGFQIEVKVKE